MGKEEHYEHFIKGKSAEEILATGAGAITGPIGDFVRVGAAVRTNQELVDALTKASIESGRVAERLVWLTGAFVAVGVLQAIVTALPYFVKP
jgi:hypothetical protein